MLLQGIEPREQSLLTQERVERPLFPDPALFQHDDVIGLFDRGETMRDDDDGSGLGEGLQGILNEPLGDAVHGVGRFVEDEKVGIPDDGAGERQPLQLAGRQPDAAVADLRQVALGKRGDEIVGVRLRGRLDDVLLAGIEPAVGDVVAHAGVEDVAVLADDRNLVSP